MSDPSLEDIKKGELHRSVPVLLVDPTTCVATLLIEYGDKTESSSAEHNNGMLSLDSHLTFGEGCFHQSPFSHGSRIVNLDINSSHFSFCPGFQLRSL